MLTSKGCCSQGWNQENPNQGAEAAEDNVVEVRHPPYKNNLPTSISIAITLHAAQASLRVWTVPWGRFCRARVADRRKEQDFSTNRSNQNRRSPPAKGISRLFLRLCQTAETSKVTSNG